MTSSQEKLINKLSRAKRCPCCSSNRVVFYNSPEPHSFCTTCFHRRKNSIPNKGYYRKLSGRSKMLEEDLKKKSLERLKFLAQYLKKGMRILEVGCAEGSFGEAIKRKFQIACYGIEPSRDSKAARTKLDGIWGSLREIPEDARFDLILSFHALEHINGIGPHISGLYKLLDDDGILILEVPNYFGNKRLPWDFNKEHIHLFSITSLSRLLEKQGFGISELRTGYYEAAIYNDSMRIIAYKRKSFKKQKSSLVSRFRRYLGNEYIIYGIGGDFEALVLPYIKFSNVFATIDSSSGNIGKRIITRTVQGPEAVTKYLTKRFLIATYRYQEEIFRILVQKGVNKSQIVTLEDIFS